MDYETILNLVKTKKDDWAARDAVEKAWNEQNPQPLEPKWEKMQKGVASIVTHSHGALWVELDAESNGSQWRNDPNFQLRLTIGDKAFNASMSYDDMVLLHDEVARVMGAWRSETVRRAEFRERNQAWNAAMQVWRDANQAVKQQANKIWEKLKKQKKLVSEDDAVDA